MSGHCIRENFIKVITQYLIVHLELRDLWKSHYYGLAVILTNGNHKEMVNDWQQKSQ